jgi:hypothetical protein
VVCRFFTKLWVVFGDVLCDPLASYSLQILFAGARFFTLDDQMETKQRRTSQQEKTKL